jgi:uncharacterized lipoprotein YajG
MRSSVRVKVTLSMRLSLISALAAASLLAGCSFDSITDRITP